MYIIRHGETEYNRMGIVQGSGVDTDINELGQQVPNALAKSFVVSVFPVPAGPAGAPPKSS